MKDYVCAQKVSVVLIFSVNAETIFSERGAGPFSFSVS